MNLWRPLTNAVLSALLSPPCAACKSVLDHPLDGAVCELCWRAIAPRAVPTCRASAAIDDGLAIGDYAGTLRELLHALKYDGRRSIAPRLARIMAEHGRELLDGADLIVPVPLHRSRERERGFNQAEDLARGLQPLPVVNLLRRTRNTPSQVDLPADERHRNVRDAFDLRSLSNGRTPADTIIILVDDVTTTGATLDACARVLKHAGAREVRALTAARVFGATR